MGINIKNKPWHEVIQFDDWAKENIEEEQDTEEIIVNKSNPQDLQVIKVKEEVDEIDLNDMIAGLNADNSSYIEKTIEEEKIKKQEALKKQIEKENAKKQEYLAKKIEIENAERDRIIFEEAEAFAKSEREKREKSITNKIDKLLNKKSPNKKENISPILSEEKEDSNSSLPGQEEQIIEDIIIDSNEDNILNENNKKDNDLEIKKEEKSKSIFVEKPKSDVKQESKQKFNFNKKQKSSNKKNNEENIEDIEQKEIENNSSTSPDWEFLATHDEMTGLLNQRAYEQIKLKKYKKPYVVVFADINNLKYVNDTLGHAAGNKLIMAVSDELKKMFPENTYRIGGDEFVSILEYSNVKKIENDIIKKRDAFNEALLLKTKKETESGLIYSASFGFSYTDGTKSFEDVALEADKAMYAVKQAYKKANPQYDLRKKKSVQPKEDNKKEYNEMLSKEQQLLKSTIKDNHRIVSVDSTSQILRDVQANATQLIAILIASPTFDQLFIILNVDTFIGLVQDMESMIDYSYLYILYEGGPQYKGSDEYLSEVTHIFEAIGNGIKTGKLRSEKDIKKIKGINIFKQIYIET